MRKQNPKEYKHCVKMLQRYLGNNKQSESTIKRLLNRAFNDHAKEIMIIAGFAYMAIC